MPEGDIFHRGDDRHAHQTGQTSEVFGQHGVALMRHCGGAFLTCREEFLGFQNLGALHMADLDGDILDAAGDHAERGKEHRVTVTRDHLGRDRLGLEAQFLADMLFHGGVDICEGADSTRDRACGDFVSGIHKARAPAIHLGIETREGQAHGGGLGMDTMRAADANGVFMLQGAGFQRGQKAVHIGQKDIGGAHQLHIQRGVQNIRGGHALMHKTRIL